MNAIRRSREAAQAWTRHKETKAHAEVNKRRAEEEAAHNTAVRQRKNTRLVNLREVQPCITLEDVQTLEDGPSVFSREAQPLARVKQQWQHLRTIAYPHVSSFPERTTTMPKAALLHLLKQVVLWGGNGEFVFSPQVVAPPPVVAPAGGVAAAATPAWSIAEVDEFLRTCKNQTKKQQAIKRQLTIQQIDYRKKRNEPAAKTLEELVEMLKSALREAPAPAIDVENGDAQELADISGQLPTDMQVDHQGETELPTELPTEQPTEQPHDEEIPTPQQHPSQPTEQRPELPVEPSLQHNPELPIEPPKPLGVAALLPSRADEARTCPSSKRAREEQEEAVAYMSTRKKQMFLASKIQLAQMRRE